MATGPSGTACRRTVRPPASIATSTEPVTPSGTPIGTRVWPVASSPR